MYVVISEGGLSQVATVFTKTTTARVNGDKTAPEVKGETSKAKYTFNNWRFNVTLLNPYFSPNTTKIDNVLDLGWLNVDFVITFNFHVCDRDFPNPCDDGDGKIYTNNNHPRLDVQMFINLNSSHPNITDTYVALPHEKGDIEVYIHCSNTICVIPPSDIADAVAQGFLPALTTTLAKSIRTEALNASSHIDLLRTIPVGKGSIISDFEGGWWTLPPSSGTYIPGMVLAPRGMTYADVSGKAVPPPYNPTFVPPAAILESPAHDMEIFFTEYFFESLLWAMAEENLFDRVEVDSDLPPASPIHLTTDDSFFSQAVPGLAKFPHMKLEVTTSMGPSDVSRSSIDASGLHFLSSNLTMSFSIDTGSALVPGWTVKADVSFDFALVPTVHGNEIMVNGTLKNINSVVSTVSSSVGSVDDSAFEQLIQFLGGALVVPGFRVPLPAGLTATNPAIQYQQGYLVLQTDFVYA
eukprot:TRINITY_DN6757_c0_g1_i2.p1 TRINITY_DN6757_c0_g1~~TRINITY_DN6757_c0_g1_i2.p1  ORF type:complete len:508 (+),score=113.78 TRINITY_DN6757_c0_g1_i2:129-1526(+)